MPAEATRPGRGKLNGVTNSTEQRPYMRKASEPGTARTKPHCSGVSSLQRSAQNFAQFAKCQLSDMCVSCVLWSAQGFSNPGSYTITTPYFKQPYRTSKRRANRLKLGTQLDVVLIVIRQEIFLSD